MISGNLRQVVKRGVETALLASGTAALSRRLHRQSITILAYHNIRSDEGPLWGDVSLHLPLASFQAHMDRVARTHRVVSLREALSETKPTRGKPRAVITFDDAYRGCLELGLPALKARGLPATIFVAPDLLGGKTFWWDALAREEGGGLEEDVRDTCLQELQGDHAQIFEWARAQGHSWREMPGEGLSGSVDELQASTSSDLFTVGSHTWSHANLQAVDDERLGTELQRSHAWMEERFGEMYLSCLAYPYGFRPSSPEFPGLSLYRSDFLLTGKIWKDPERNRKDVPRINIPSGMSVRGLELRASGVLNL